MKWKRIGFTFLHFCESVCSMFVAKSELLFSLKNVFFFLLTIRY